MRESARHGICFSVSTTSSNQEMQTEQKLRKFGDQNREFPGSPAPTLAHIGPELTCSPSWEACIPELWVRTHVSTG